MVIMINLWPSLDFGLITPIRSIAHIKNGNGDVIIVNAYNGLSSKFACCLELTYLLKCWKKSYFIVGQ